MASIIFATRGISHQIEMWKIFMQSQMYQWQRKNLQTNGIETMTVQGALRPIQFWEYVVPKSSIQDVLTNMRIVNYEGFTVDPKAGNTLPNPVNPNMPAGVHALAMVARKALKLKEFPTATLKPGMAITRPLYVEGVTIHPIGYKDDKIDANEVIGYEQEMI